ncbi:MAG: hypothetical protein IKF90_15710 [Parasporobacterium sp.]|nr:hypothetical protein [Parasporobacterium sp.]
MIKFISKSSNLFETDHSVNTDVGDVFTFDPPDGADPTTVRQGDSESSGIMLPLDGKIYYMPVVSEVEMDPSYRTLWCYDPAEDQWTNENIPAFLYWISNASGTFHNKTSCHYLLYYKNQALFNYTV